jgi:hypothetical protein
MSYTLGDNRAQVKFQNEDLAQTSTTNAHGYNPSSNRLATIGTPDVLLLSNDALGRRTVEQERNDGVDARSYTYLPSGQLAALRNTEPGAVSPNGYVLHDSTSAYDQQRRRYARARLVPGYTTEEQWEIYYGLNGEVLEEKHVYDSGDPNAFEIIAYNYLDGLRVARDATSYVPCPQGSCSLGGGRGFYVGDHLGVPVAAVHGILGTVPWRLEYDAFGWSHPSDGGNAYHPHRFPGQLEDPGTSATIWDPACYPNCSAGQTVTLRPNLVYNWHRTFDPYTGRYLEATQMGSSRRPRIPVDCQQIGLLTQRTVIPMGSVGGIRAETMSTFTRDGRESGAGRVRTTTTTTVGRTTYPRDRTFPTRFPSVRSLSKDQFPKTRTRHLIRTTQASSPCFRFPCRLPFQSIRHRYSFPYNMSLVGERLSRDRRRQEPLGFTTTRQVP